MFKFLKDKLKNAVSSISKSVEEEETKESVDSEENTKEEQKKEEAKEENKQESKQTEEKKGFFSFLRRKKTEEQEEVKEVKEEHKETVKEEPKKEKEESKEKIKEKKEKEEQKEEQKKESKPKTQKKEKIDNKKVSKKEKIIQNIKENINKESEKEPLHEAITFQSKEEVQEKKLEDSKFTKIEQKQEVIQETNEEQEQQKEDTKEQKEEKQGFFSKLKKKFTHTKISEEKFEELFWNLEVGLMEANVAVEVIEKIKKDLKEQIVDKELSRGNVETVIVSSLKSSVEGLFEAKLNLVHQIKSKSEKDKPYIIAFVGINGVGKTTSLAKVAKRLEKEGLKSVIAAADTFRVAAIEQLEQHANKLGIKMIKHDYGADPAAVCYDAVEHAKARQMDVVLIDTAGRNNVNENLLAELKKIIKVAKPNLVVFVGDSLTGNDMVEQAKVFNDTVGIDAIILSKADVDEKGGGALSVSYVTHKPILYLGTGQNYEDLVDFSSKTILENLGLV